MMELKYRTKHEVMFVARGDIFTIQYHKLYAIYKD